MLSTLKKTRTNSCPFRILQLVYPGNSPIQSRCYEAKESGITHMEPWTYHKPWNQQATRFISNKNRFLLRNFIDLGIHKYARLLQITDNTNNIVNISRPRKNTVQCYCLRNRFLPTNYSQKMQSIIYIKINGYISTSNKVGVANEMFILVFDHDTVMHSFFVFGSFEWIINGESQ